LIPLLCIGLTPSIAVGILFQGFRKGGVFHRTPKFGVMEGQSGGERSVYRTHHTVSHVLNTLLTIYTLVPVIFAIQRGTWPAVPFLSLFPAGLILVMLNDIPWFQSDLKERSEIDVSSA
jgi:hypothetical protein